MFYVLFVFITFLGKMNTKVVEIETEAIDRDVVVVSPIHVQVTVLTTDQGTPNVIWSIVDIQRNFISNLTSLTDRIRPSQHERFSSTAYIDFPNTRELVGHSVRLKIRAFYDGQNGITVYSRGFFRFNAPWTLSMERFAVMGEVLETSCEYDDDDSPTYARYDVILKNTTQLKIRINARSCKITSSIYDANISCANTTFTLAFNEAKVEFNQSYWRCVDSLDRTKTSRFQKLEIAVEPSDVKIYPRKISAFEGKNVTMRCESQSIGYPKPSYKWFIGKQETSVTTPNITFNLQRTYHGLNVTCIMTTIPNRTKMSETEPIEVHYIPIRGLVMDGIKNKLYRDDGKDMLVTCWIPTANPSPQVTLSCTDGSNATSYSNETIVSAWLLLHRDRRLNGVECNCKVFQAITMFSDVEHRTINVIYAPSIIVLSSTVSNGDENIRIDCNVSANPAVSWLHWEHRVGDIVVRNQSALKLFINKSLPQSLLFPIVSYEDHGIYTCFASNGVSSINGNLVTMASGKLTVKVRPLLIDLPLNYVGYLGHPLSIRFSFYSCPRVSLSNITINREENVSNVKRSFVTKDARVQLVFHGKQIGIDGQLLIMKIQQVNRTSTGKYIVHVENRDSQESTSYFIIKVREEPIDTSTHRVGDIILRWISPGLLCLVAVGAAIFILNRHCKKRRSEEIQMRADCMNEVQSNNDPNTNMITTESVYCSVSCSSRSESGNINNSVQEVTLLAESTFMSQESLENSIHSGEDVDNSFDSDNYETLATDKRCDEDDYSSLQPGTNP